MQLRRRVGKVALRRALNDQASKTRRAHACGLAKKWWARRDGTASRVDDAVFARLCPPYGVLPQAGVDLVQRGRARTQVLFAQRIERGRDRVEMLVQILGFALDVEQPGDEL